MSTWLSLQIYTGTNYDNLAIVIIIVQKQTRQNTYIPYISCQVCWKQYKSQDSQPSRLMFYCLNTLTLDMIACLTASQNPCIILRIIINVFKTTDENRSITNSDHELRHLKANHFQALSLSVYGCSILYTSLPKTK